MNRYYPSLKEIIYTTISIIHNHPYIQNPLVKSPVPDLNGNYLPIPIDRYRNYDGLELQEPGLTLSIFPKFSPAEKSYGDRLATTYTPVTMGGKHKGFMYEATYSLVIHLAYQEVALNETKQLIYVKDKFNNVSSDKEKLIDNSGDLFPKSGVVPIEVNVAEDILRDYLEIIRIIIEQVDYYAPWNLRGTSITGMGFPSTSWSQESKQIYFHQAYMNWEISTYAPSTYDQPYPIRNLEVTSRNVSKL